MLTVASISARAGSKGVPGKNLRKIADIPLIERAIITCKQVSLVDAIFVSSDDPDVLEIASKHDCISYERPPNLADDHTSLHMVTKHNTEQIRELLDIPDCIVQFSPTCPFIKPSTVELGIQKVLYNGNSSAVSLFKVEHSHPYRARILDDNGSFTNFITDIDVESSSFHSRQDLPELWCTSGGLYIRDYKTISSLDGNSFGFGVNPYGLKLDYIEALNIDNLIDFEFAEFLASRHAEL